MNTQKHILANRYREIRGVLARFGLDFLRGSLGGAANRPVRLRQALEELGPTFIKLGQILSTRVDLLPPEYLKELSKLQDSAPALAPEAVRAILTEEFGPDAERKFASFDAAPLAAASIGQTHAATLKDGTSVVVKVRRPGVLEQIGQDVAVLEDLSRVALRRWPMAQDYDIGVLVEEYAESLRAETDYVREARNAKRFANDFRDDDTVHIPRIIEELTTARILTMERISGRKLIDLGGQVPPTVDRHELAAHLARMVLTMVFQNGFFHADPHPGNFFVENDGRIGVVDFGLVGKLDARARDQLVWALIAFASGDADRQVDALFDLGVVGRPVDRPALRRDVERLFGHYYDRAVGNIAIRALIQDVISIIQRHHLQLPSNFALLMKTIVMHEGLALEIDPEFNLAPIVTPYAERIILDHFSPRQLSRQLGDLTLETIRLAEQFPRQARRIMAALERGDLEIAMRPSGIEPIITPLRGAIKQLALSILSMSLVVSLAILLAALYGSREHWVVAVLASGLVVGILASAYLAWRIARRS